MNARKYKARLSADLDRWIANGWVPQASRELILADIPDDARGRARLWLGMTGAVLAGLAIIAGIADNWAVVPRALKLGILLAGFWISIGAAAFADFTARKHLRNGTALLAALIFAASIGLLGQALNIPGDASAALMFGALGAAAIAIGASSSAAGVVYLVLSSLWYWSQGDMIDLPNGRLGLRDAGAGAFLLGGFAIAAALRARVLLHASLAVAGPFVLIVAFRLLDGMEAAYAAFGVWALVAAPAVALMRFAGARTIFGWAVWHALIGFGIAGLDEERDLLHRAVWIALSIGVIAISARISQGWAIGGGVLGLVVASLVVLVDLGMGLGTAAALFGVAALIVLGVTLVLARRAKDGEP